MVSSDETQRPSASRTALLLAGLTVLAFGLRFWRLGNWGFDSDESFMLRDSIDLDPRNPRPLLYVLNHYLVRPFLPLDEFSLRLLPAIFGILAIPTFYLVGRRLVGTRAALFGALLLAVSPLHVYYSQFARYWSLVFLLSAVYPYAIYLGLRERNHRLLALGLVTGLLAVVAHPASVLLVTGLGVWLLATYLKREHLALLWSQKRIRSGVLLGVVLAGVIVARFVPMLQAWILAHDMIPEGERGGEFLLHTPSGLGVKQIAYLLGFAESLPLPLLLIAALGVYLLWRARNRSLALLLASMFVLPLALLVLLSFRTPVSTFYLVPTLPVLFIAAGVFLDRLADVDLDLRPRWLLSATVTVMIVAAGAPTLISQYRDGRRYDFRGAAHWLQARLRPEDVVFSDQPKVMAFYMPEAQVQRLMANTAPLTQSIRLLHQSGAGAGALWIVSPAPSHAFRTNPHLDSLNGWIYNNCQLRNTIGVARVDFRQNLLQIYRCPPARAEGITLPERDPTAPGPKADRDPAHPAGL